MTITRLATCAALGCAGMASSVHAEPVTELSGSLASGDTFEADGKLYDDHVLQLESGQRYLIAVGSDDFDTLIRVYGVNGGSPLGENDDGAESGNSELVFTPQESGSYVLRVTSFEAGSSGDYGISVSEMLPPVLVDRKPDARETMSFALYRGTLRTIGEETETLNFPVNVKAGETLLVQAASADFDTVLNIYRVDQFGGEAVAENDDAGSSNSLISYTFEEGGDFLISLSAFDGSGDGSYTLRIGR